ncbi:EAL domain-containing protein [Neorhizobium sp. T786]|uniref:sensor domain-containing protein n=1 Tax=Pseudorhizobium xiangyangii TaxID=2883104 RepID=UPI001CFF61F5|nr:EAL domain-containing protein [Neorhizobium xiangyangii]MCB5203821.1 EAL domain-containing protein [Neorhizobium xiangyangii]
MDFKAAFLAIPLPAALCDHDLNIQACNPAFARALKKKEDEITGRPLLEAVDQEDRDAISASFQAIVAKKELPSIGVESGQEPNQIGLGVRKNTFINIPIFAPRGTLEAVLHCRADDEETSWIHRTDELYQGGGYEVQHALDAERDRIRQLFKQAPGFICLLRGPQHIYELANDAYHQLIGHREIIGHPLPEVLPEVIPQGFLDKLNRVYTTGEPFIGRAIPIQLQRLAEGELEQRFIDLIYQPMRDPSGTISGIFVQGHDVTEAHELAREVTFQAAHDPLTSLLNRREFARKMGEIDGQASHALVYADLDHFKIVNDRCGHTAGDALLTQVAQVLREQCSDGDLLARLGGDEFALVRCDSTLDKAVELADRMREGIKGINFVWQGKPHSITLSAGVAVFGGNEGLPFDVALGLADAACFLAKEKGRDRVKVSSVTDDEVRQQQTDMDGVTRLKEALREDRIILYGQRIVALQPYEDQRSFLEVLARIVDHDGTIIGPGAFIPAAERFGLIQEVDYHIVTKAFMHLLQLSVDERARKLLFINLSGITLSAPDFSVFIAQLMQSFPGVSPSQICFEVTETAAISNISRTAEAMRRLIDKGFSFALDDFGSGMASFSYLNHLPVQFVKIDGEFVKAIRSQPAGPVIVEAVVKVARAMNMQTIAESVEYEELLPHLRELGLDYGQGYALHCPETLDQAMEVNPPPVAGVH